MCRCSANIFILCSRRYLVIVDMISSDIVTTKFSFPGHFMFFCRNSLSITIRLKNKTKRNLLTPILCVTVQVKPKLSMLCVLSFGGGFIHLGGSFVISTFVIKTTRVAICIT